MAVTFSQAKTIIKNNLGESDTDTDTYVGQCLDVSQRDVARAHAWPELRKRTFFNTVAAYSTGTVAVTLDSTTVTLTSGTWPSDVASASYRFALGFGSQWYTVATRSSDTVILLAEAYKGVTDASNAYVVYKNVYDLASDVEKITKLWIHDSGRAVELTEEPDENWVTDWGHYPSGSGTPNRYVNVERTAAGLKQIMVGPEAPGSAFRVEYKYRKAITEGSFVLSEALVDLVIYKAQAMAYERDHFQRSVAMMERWPRMLANEIARSGDTENSSIIVGQGRLLGVDSYFDNIVDYGTVAED